MKRSRRLLSALLAACLAVAAAPLGAAAATAAIVDTPTYTQSKIGVSIGWEGDMNAARTYIDGSFILRDDRGYALGTEETLVTLGISSYGVPAHWSLAEHYLPCTVSSYEQSGYAVKVENFGDCVRINGRDYVVIYTRQTLENLTAEALPLPVVSELLTPLNDAAAENSQAGAMIGAGETLVREYATCSDRFGDESAPWPEPAELVALGGFDGHYAHMKTYWEALLGSLVQITAVPAEAEDLLYEYKAGYIFQMIAKDGKGLNVNESCYDDVYNHDYLNILSNLVQLGDFRYFDDYAEHLYEGMGGYADAPYKAAFPLAYYIQKTGDTAVAEKHFDRLLSLVHHIEENREDTGLLNPDGTQALVQGASISIDKRGTWLLDSESALAGLAAYKYVCLALDAAQPDSRYQEEILWADALYRQQLTSVETVVRHLMDTYGISYLPMSMLAPNDLTNRGSARDSNALAIFLFGFWSWDGYLMGIDQTGSVLLDAIDDTYTYHLATRDALNQSPSMYNAGAYGGYIYSGAYNAGYGTGGLRSSLYRDWGVNALLWSLHYSQMAPYSWSENVAFPSTDPGDYGSYSWADPEAFTSKATGGDDTHLWGQACVTQTVMASFVSERADGTVLIGTGLPYSWFRTGETVAVENFPCARGSRLGYRITVPGEKTVCLTVSSETPVPVEFCLPAFIGNVESAADDAGHALPVDQQSGSVKIPAGVAGVTVTLKNSAAVQETARDAAVAIEWAGVRADNLTAGDYTAASYRALTDAVRTGRALVDSGTATARQLTDARDAILAAEAALAYRADGDVLESTAFALESFYLDCDLENTIYQTFTTGSSAGRVDFAEVWAELILPAGYRFDGIRCTVYALNPSKYYPYRLGDALGEATLAKGDGQNYRYRFAFDSLTLEPNTRYALALSMNRSAEYTEEEGGTFRWILTDTLPGEFLINRTAAGKMSDVTYQGGGSFRIVFGTPAADPPVTEPDLGELPASLQRMAFLLVDAVAFPMIALTLALPLLAR